MRGLPRREAQQGNRHDLIKLNQTSKSHLKKDEDLCHILVATSLPLASPLRLPETSSASVELLDVWDRLSKAAKDCSMLSRLFEGCACQEHNLIFWSNVLQQGYMSLDLDKHLLAGHLEDPIDQNKKFSYYVFHVTKGGKFYGLEGPYGVFVHRGLATFCLDKEALKDEYDDLSDLTPAQQETLSDWDSQFTFKYHHEKAKVTFQHVQCF
ncbi:hypothetical protein GH733_001541 [Mirounga leonina]|nr:hypothetical protein GH733_001541 [Mirounga leonina]